MEGLELLHGQNLVRGSVDDSMILSDSETANAELVPLNLAGPDDPHVPLHKGEF